MIVIGTLQISSTIAHPVQGAIFTTLPDGSVVNGNIYQDKCDVALNGGPQGPQSHHLPDGSYDVAVTDPSGKMVLGQGFGTVVINNGQGTFGPTSLCTLVGPSPYASTPNPGGEYKAWLCVTGNLFVNHDCKTDNFKVKEPTPTLPPTLPPTTTTPPTQPPTLTSTPTITPLLTPTETPVVGTLTPTPTLPPIKPPTEPPVIPPTEFPTKVPTPVITPTPVATVTPGVTPTEFPTKVPTPVITPTPVATVTPGVTPTLIPPVSVTPIPEESPAPVVTPGGFPNTGGNPGSSDGVLLGLLMIGAGIIIGSGYLLRRLVIN